MVLVGRLSERFDRGSATCRLRTVNLRAALMACGLVSLTAFIPANASELYPQTSILGTGKPASLSLGSERVPASCCAVSGDAQTPSLTKWELWKEIVDLFSRPDGRVDLDWLKDALHVDPAADQDPEDRHADVYRGAVGPGGKLGYLFVTPDRPQWSITFFWLDDPSALRKFQFGHVPVDMCIPLQRVEAELVATGWKETFGYSQFKSPPEGVLTAWATFRKGRTELVVNLDREMTCFSYLKEAVIPHSRFDAEANRQ